MELAGITQIDQDRCTNLRWKGMYISVEWDNSVQHGNDRLYWCQHTQNCIGPDGKAVDDYECNEGRRCYREL